MAADSPLALNLRDCYFRPSTRRTPQSQQRRLAGGGCRLPRDGGPAEGASLVNPFAYSPPNPFLLRAAGGGAASQLPPRNPAQSPAQKGTSSSSSSCASSASLSPFLVHPPPPLEPPLLNKNFSFSTPSSPRHGSSSLSSTDDVVSLSSASSTEESSSYLSVLSPAAGMGGPSSKRRRSIQIDGGVQAPPMSCADASFGCLSSSSGGGGSGFVSSSSSSSSSASPFSSFSSSSPFSGRINAGVPETAEFSSKVDLSTLPAISVTEPPKNESEMGGGVAEEEEEQQGEGKAVEGKKKEPNNKSTNGELKNEAKPPTVFIDSGSYSLCYHTSMTAPPPTLSMAPLSTHFASEDREARRRRKACISVLRSVQSSLQSTPESSPHLGPSTDPSTSTSPFLSSSVLPPPPPAVRQPFFPSAFGEASTSSSFCSSSASAGCKNYPTERQKPQSSSCNSSSRSPGSGGGGGGSFHTRVNDRSPEASSAGSGGVCTPEKNVESGNHQQLTPLAQLRLRPDFFSPCTLATLIGACVHAYDEVRSAYPPPEPPPRLCVLSLPALYVQLPPHLANTAVLLDIDAPFVGQASRCLPIESSRCVFNSCSPGTASTSSSLSGYSQASSTQGGLEKHDVLPSHLHGEFDIIVCETRTVTVGAVENTAACIRALSRHRSSPVAQSSPHHMAERSSGQGFFSAGGGHQGLHCTSIEAAAEALSGLSLQGGGGGHRYSGPSVYAEKRALPPSTRVIMLSTCLLSPLVDDLLGLKQCPFQPYIPSSALSSLQLQCIYTNFATFAPLQRHNDVDFSTRVRVRSKSRPGAKSADGSSSKDSPPASSSGAHKEGNDSYDEHRHSFSPSAGIVGSDDMVARAMVLHTQEEERAARRGQESGAEGALWRGNSESCFSSEEEATMQQQESVLLKAFDGLQLCVGRGAREVKILGESADEEGAQGFEPSGMFSVQKGQGGRSRSLRAGTAACGSRTPDPRALTGREDVVGRGPVGLFGQGQRQGKREQDVAETGRSQACKGITMRTGADADDDDGIDYELECGSHFGMASHDL